MQSGNFQFDINPAHFKVLSTRKLKHGNASKGILKTLFEKYKLELTHVFKLVSITHSLRLIRNRIFSVKLEWSSRYQPKRFAESSVVPSFLVKKGENFPCTRNLGERTRQVWLDNGRRLRTHKKIKKYCSPNWHRNTKNVLCPIRSQHSLDLLEMV